jgi:hypothetical protein
VAQGSLRHLRESTWDILRELGHEPMLFERKFRAPKSSVISVIIDKNALLLFDFIRMLIGGCSMATKVYVSLNGVVTEAVGTQPKDALLFAPSKKSAAQVILEQRENRRRNSHFIKERLEEAFKR